MTSPSISSVGSVAQWSVGIRLSVSSPPLPSSPVAASSSSRELHADASSASVSRDAPIRALRLLNMVTLLERLSSGSWSGRRPSPRRRALTEAEEEAPDAAHQPLGQHEHDHDERGAEQRRGEDLLALDEVLGVAAQQHEHERADGGAQDRGGAADHHGHQE